VERLAEQLVVAADAIDSGSAAVKLDSWAAATQRHAG
jgi:anthranilate phosphoribosyltransferase